MAVNSDAGPRNRKVEEPSWWGNFAGELFSMDTVKGTARNVGDIVTGNAPDNEPAEKDLLSRAGESVGKLGGSLLDPILGSLKQNLFVVLVLLAGAYLVFGGGFL